MTVLQRGLMVAGVWMLAAGVAAAAPIFSNLTDVIVPVNGPVKFKFWSEEPFRFGGFFDPLAVAQPTLANPYNPFFTPMHFDGRFWRISGVLPTRVPGGCGRDQVDVDSPSFAGIGVLFVWPGDCQPIEPPLPPRFAPPSFPPTFPPTFDPPTLRPTIFNEPTPPPPTPVPEPGTLGLTALGGWLLSRARRGVLWKHGRKTI